MIEIRDCGFNYNVRCTDKKQYNKFINYMVFNELTKKMDIGWKMPKELLSELEDLLGGVKLIANEWDYVGSDMKLTPYSYQKEAIHFAANREKTLLILPCGAGKTAILVGIYHELRRQNKTDKKGIIVVKASLKYQ